MLKYWLSQTFQLCWEEQNQQNFCFKLRELLHLYLTCYLQFLSLVYKLRSSRKDLHCCSENLQSLYKHDFIKSQDIYTRQCIFFRVPVTMLTIVSSLNYSLVHCCLHAKVVIFSISTWFLRIWSPYCDTNQ